MYELRAATFEAYAAFEEEGAKQGTEQVRRERALQGIDEILEWRPLATFSARTSSCSTSCLLIGARPAEQ